jgi:hypothetical protein
MFHGPDFTNPSLLLSSAFSVAARPEYAGSSTLHPATIANGTFRSGVFTTFEKHEVLYHCG